jgi:hypothetical protein
MSDDDAPFFEQKHKPFLEPAADVGDYVLAVERIRERMCVIQNEYRERLPLWMVFGPNTRDHPGMFLVRLWLTLPEPAMTNILARANSLAEIRDLLPDTLTCLPRDPSDDHNIIESWI